MSPPKKPKGRSKVVDVAKNARLTQLRKERSRDAARSRRGKENTQFDELAKLLPLPNAITSQLDKASIVRLAISFLKMREFTGLVPQSDGGGNSSSSQSDLLLPFSMHSMKRRIPTVETFENELGVHLLTALDGFLFAVDQEGKFIYVSETVTMNLGLSQVEMTGSLVYQYLHPDDVEDFKKQLSLDYQPEGELDQDGGLSRSFFVRMKCTLVKRSGSYAKSSAYKVVHCIGRLQNYNHEYCEGVKKFALVVIAQPMLTPCINEIRLEYSVFVSRVNMDLKIVYCEGRIRKFVDYAAKDIVGRSAYEFYHLGDVDNITEAHNQFLNKGQVVTKYYRWMGKTGGWNWFQTKCLLVSTPGQPDKKQMLCMNYVISGKEHQGVVLGLDQLQSSQEPVRGRIVELDNDRDAEVDSTLGRKRYDADVVDRKPGTYMFGNQNQQMPPNMLVEPEWPLLSEDSQDTMNIATIIEANLPGFLSQITNSGNAGLGNQPDSSFQDRLNRSSFVSDDSSFGAEQDDFEFTDFQQNVVPRSRTVSENSCFSGTPPDNQVAGFNSGLTNNGMQGYGMSTFGDLNLGPVPSNGCYSSGISGNFASTSTNNRYIPPSETITRPNAVDLYSAFPPMSTQGMLPSDIVNLTSTSNVQVSNPSVAVPNQNQYSWSAASLSGSVPMRNGCSYVDPQKMSCMDPNIDVKPNVNVFTPCSQGVNDNTLQGLNNTALPMSVANTNNLCMDANESWMNNCTPGMSHQYQAVPLPKMNPLPQLSPTDQVPLPLSCQSQVVPSGGVDQTQMYRQMMQQMGSQIPGNVPGLTAEGLDKFSNLPFYGNT